MATARSKAIAFAAVLILVSGVFVATAAASTTSALSPFRNGDAYALERPLSRHGVALGVVVGATVDGEIVRAEGAQVVLTALTPTAEGRQVSKETNAAGHVVFHVPRGTYRLDVSWGNVTDSRSHALSTNMRLGVLFDESGAAHWTTTGHRDLERRGETKALVVRVTEAAEDGRHPVADVTVTVHRVPAETQATALEAEKKTGPRGFAAFQLHKGTYEVTIAWEGQTATSKVPLRNDRAVFFVIDEDGPRAAESSATERPPR